MPFHSFTPDRDGWATVADEITFANPYLEIHRVSVTSPTREKPFQWTVCHRKGAVVVAARTAAGDFLLIRQERVPIRATIWEFPAGQIDEATDHDQEAIRSTGLRELQEESGYELAPGGSVEPLGFFFPSAGFTDEHSHLVLAGPVVESPLGKHLDEDEGIGECIAVSPAKLAEMIASGEIRDANTLCAFARMVAMGVIRL